MANLTMSAVMVEFYDGPHATPPPSVEGPIYLGIKNLTEDGHLDLSDIRHIHERDFARWTKRVEPRAGDIVFTYEASLHRYAVIPAGFRGALGRRVALLRPDPHVVDTRFLLYAFISPKWRRTVTERINVGSTVDRIPLVDFPRFPISVPPLSTQRKIATALSAYDDLIENNDRRIRILEEIAQRIYREWFVDFRYPGHEGVPLVASELGPNPQGWQIRTIAQLCGARRDAVASGPFGSKLGQKDYVSAGVPVIRGSNLQLGGGFRETGFVYVTEKKATELTSSLAYRGDIVITQRGTLGQVGVIPSSARYSRYVLSQSQMKVTVDSNVANSDYVYAALRSSQITKGIQDMAISAGVPHINLGMLRSLKLACPPVALQIRFGEVAGAVSSLVTSIQSANENLRTTRDLLLPRLISGELDVDDLDIAMPDAAA